MFLLFREITDRTGCGRRIVGGVPPRGFAAARIRYNARVSGPADPSAGRPPDRLNMLDVPEQDEEIDGEQPGRAPPGAPGEGGIS